MVCSGGASGGCTAAATAPTAVLPRMVPGAAAAACGAVRLSLMRGTASVFFGPVSGERAECSLSLVAAGVGDGFHRYELSGDELFASDILKTPIWSLAGRLYLESAGAPLWIDELQCKFGARYPNIVLCSRPGGACALEGVPR